MADNRRNLHRGIVSASAPGEYLGWVLGWGWGCGFGQFIALILNFSFKEFMYFRIAMNFKYIFNILIDAKGTNK